MAFINETKYLRRKLNTTNLLIYIITELYECLNYARRIDV